jgi:ABC-type sugar transport system permease subunit
MVDVPVSSPSSFQPKVAVNPRRRKWRDRNRQAMKAWLLMAPILIYFSFFFLFPVVSSFAISFVKWAGVGPAPVWVGLKNYERWLTDPYYTQAFINTAIFALSILFIQTGLAILVALMLNTKVWGRGLYRTAWFIPGLAAASVMANVISMFIAPGNGVFSLLVAKLGGPALVMYMRPDLMRLVIIFYSVWRGVGGGVILYLAALQSIHPEFYEAAQVDGANSRQMLRYITVPLLAPMTLFVLVTGIIGTAQIFEAVQFLTKGGPQNQTNVLMYAIYQEAWQNSSLGMASSGAILLGILLLASSIVNIRVMTKGRIQD